LDTCLGTVANSHWIERTSASSGGWVPYVQQEYGAFFTPYDPTVTGYSETSADNQALKLAYRRLRETRRDFQAGIFLGEGGEALKMIRDRGQKLFLGLSNYLSFTAGNAVPTKFRYTTGTNRTWIVRGMKITRKVRTRKTNWKALSQWLSGNWLEYSFGAKPLANDLSDAVKAYQGLLEQTDKHRERIPAFGKNQEYFFEDRNRTSVGNVYYLRQFQVRGSVSVRYILFIEYSAKGWTPENDVLHRFGLTAEEFVPTIWELTPWSFLWDYFTNIGDILEATTTATSEVKFVVKTVRKWAVSEVKASVDESYMRSLYGNTPKYEWSGSPGYTMRHKKYVVRSALGSIPFPRLQLSIPNMGTQWLNMAALATQKLTTQSTLLKRFGRLG